MRQLLDAIAKLKAIPAGPEREAAVTSLGISPAALPVAAAIVALPDARIEAVAGAVQQLVGAVESTGGGGGGASVTAAIPAEAVVTLAATFRELPPAARKASLQMVPNEMRPAAVAMQFMEPSQVGKLAAEAPELARAASAVMEAPPASTTAEEYAKARAARLAAATKLHRVFKSLPPRARTEMARVLPPKVQPAVQMADGYEERDLDLVLTLVDKQMGAAPAPIASTPPATGGAGASGASSVGGRPAPSPADADAERKRAAKQAARVAARAEARRLARWVKGSPCALRTLNFMGGLALCFAGLTGILIQTFNEFRIWAIVIEFYIFVFGIIVCGVEVESQLCTKYIGANVQKWGQFLSTSTGRGHFLWFVGFLSLSLWDPTTDGWTELFNIGSGFFVLVLAIVNWVAGYLASQKLRRAAAAVGSEAELRRRFEEADVAMHGVLEPEDIVQLLGNLDPPTHLSDAELRAAVLSIDRDHDGGVTLAELIAWWKSTAGGVRTATMESDVTPAGSSGSKKWVLITGGPRSLRLLSLIAGVVYTISGFVGLWTEALVASGATATTLEEALAAKADAGTWFLRFILNFYIVLFGLVVSGLESRARIRGVVFAVKVSDSFRLLTRVWGRGAVYQFLGFVALSQWRLEELSNIIGGFVMVGIGALNLIVGGLTAKALRGTGSLSVDVANKKFDEADGDGDGLLDEGEFKSLMGSLGVDLNPRLLEAAFVELDINGTGRIDRREFLLWTQGSVVTDVVEHGAAAAEADGERGVANPLLAAPGGGAAAPSGGAASPKMSPLPV